MLRVRAKYAPGICVYDGSIREVRWDLSGCNLRCQFCWSPASRPLETSDAIHTLTTEQLVTETRRHLAHNARSFIRFTGGEPTLQWKDLMEVLDQLQSAISLPRPTILFQTNGIEIGRGSVPLEPLAAHSDQHYLFELSFKGTNPEEFSLLTGKAAELYEYQLEGYQRLLDISRTCRNVRVVAVLGVYHSATKRPSKYAFVNPKSGTLLFENPENWNSGFSALWRGNPLKWVEPLRMSPMGVWKNVLKRCGQEGSGILRNFPAGIPTNVNGLFPAKPRSADYARQIVTKRYWQ